MQKEEVDTEHVEDMGEMGDIEDVEEIKRRARDLKMHVERIKRAEMDVFEKIAEDLDKTLVLEALVDGMNGEKEVAAEIPLPLINPMTQKEIAKFYEENGRMMEAYATHLAAITRFTMEDVD